MDRIRRFFARLWSGLVGLFGFDRVVKATRTEDISARSRMGRIAYFVRPAIAAVVLLYLALLIGRFSVIHGDELSYPQRVILEPEQGVGTPGAPLPGQTGVCRRSQTVEAVAYILDVLVNQNTWVPQDPQFKIGFGFVGFDPTPFFDNKAAFQVGAMQAVRRLSIELADTLGRARRTSAPDTDLLDARGAVQWNERAWIINPFDSRVPLISTSAASAYRNAIRDYENFNARLAACEGLFDARPDSLFVILERIANDIGGLSEQLAARSKGERWDVATKSFQPAEGNDRGFFDFRADNLFWRSHGMMWAYHGIMQGMRYDFADAIAQGNMAPIWDRMEGHIAEAARMRPTIVSNGRDDSLFQPDHLSLLAVNMLRAQANMIEMREVINR